MTSDRFLALRRGASAAAALAVLSSGVVRAQGPDTVPAKKVAANPSLTGPADPPARQGFGIVLIVGDMQGAESLEALPVAARKALADMKDFLPYKSYRVLDTQWTLCCSGSSPTITRLRGLDDQEYELELRSSPKMTPGSARPSGGFLMRFLLREPGDAYAPLTKLTTESAESSARRAAEVNQQLFALERERLDLSADLTELRRKAEVGMKDPADIPRISAQLQMVERRIVELKHSQAPPATPKAVGRTVIDTSFPMDPGETVVVGTSRLKGGSRALIALLTAVAPRSKQP